MESVGSFLGASGVALAILLSLSAVGSAFLIKQPLVTIACITVATFGALLRTFNPEPFAPPHYEVVAVWAMVALSIVIATFRFVGIRGLTSKVPTILRTPDSLGTWIAVGITALGTCYVAILAYRAYGWPQTEGDWFLALCVLGGIAFVYFVLAAGKWWGGYPWPLRILSVGVFTLLLAFIGGQRPSFLGGTSDPRPPLVPKVTAIGSTAPIYHFKIPRELGYHTVTSNGRELRIPAHSTIQICAVGSMDFDPDGSRQETLAWQYRKLASRGKYAEAEKYAVFTRPNRVLVVYPDSGFLSPSVFGSQADRFPLPDSPFGRPIFRVGNGPPQPLPSSWVTITNPIGHDITLRVALNMDPGSPFHIPVVSWVLDPILFPNSLASWLWQPEGKFTLKIRGIELPVS